MKPGLLLFLLAVLAASLALPQSPTPPQQATPKKASPKTASATSSKTAAAKKGKSSKKSVRPAVASRPRQITPTPERYRDIQQALADKGYLKSEPNGVWDPQSTEALRQFQTDRNLSPTGKITSAALIGLGLGPKTDSAGSAVPVGDKPSRPEPSPTPAPEN